jgi:hypothetical protein
MDNAAAEKLTNKQQVWLKHIQTAEVQGKSLSQYARDNDLKLGALYNWKWVLKNEGKLAAPTKKPFIKVARSIKSKPIHLSLAPSLQVRFPNQTQVEIQIATTELPQLLAMIKSL